MFRIVLVEPEIPPNTGNIIRLAANTGSQLHLVAPLGFELRDKQLRRAGLDYHEFSALKVHASFDQMLATESPLVGRMFAFTTRASRLFNSVSFDADDWFIFGSETAGLPDAVRKVFPETQRLRLPMKSGNRSLNLSNAVAVVIFEAWRQMGYEGGS